MWRIIFLAATTILVVGFAAGESSTTTETSDDTILEEARKVMEEINKEWELTYNKFAIASWNYESNLTDENLQIQLNASAALASFVKQATEKVQSYPWENFSDLDLKRQFMLLNYSGMDALPESEYQEREKIISSMETTYSTATICAYNNSEKCDLPLDPDIMDLVASSQDPEELKYLWVEWRKVFGEEIKSEYTRYVELSNMGALLNDEANYADYWLKDYEADDFQEQIDVLWQQLKPLYDQLHAYVRRQLRIKYGAEIVSEDGPIPAHLLGNVWAQEWQAIADMTLPYPGQQLPDITARMVEQKYNATRMFRLAEEFFISLNLGGFTDLFWQNSILEKPTDREIVCHPSAWDFADGKDYRIKQCTTITLDSFLTGHHETGHIKYYMQYKDLPTVYRSGANPGFHEAIGDVIALSTSTIRHFKKIELLDDDTVNTEAMINYLYAKALEKIAFLPFSYALDRWRWSVFDGTIKPEEYNCKWWEIVHEYQGVEPPVDRSEEDFDPAAKYHVVADVEYLRYFIAFVIQFQFHKALCETAGEYDPTNSTLKPLHQCDIYQSTEAGERFGSMLQLGASKPWQDAMEVIAGQRVMDASGLLEYFNPLIEWLTAENEKNNEYIGWKPTTKRCVKTAAELTNDET